MSSKLLSAEEHWETIYDLINKIKSNENAENIAMILVEHDKTMRNLIEELQEN